MNSAGSESPLKPVLQRVRAGDLVARDEMFALVYQDLRHLAQAKLKELPPGQTLQPTALVHDAWARLVPGKDVHFEDRQHFFLAAAQAMRSILVDSGRRRLSAKRGGGRRRVDLARLNVAATAPAEDLVALNEAVERLDPHHRRLVELRFFIGLGMPEVAETLGLPLRTVEREWTYVRALLHRELTSE